MRPSTLPEWVVGATRTTESARPWSRAGSQISTQAVPVTPARATTVSSSGLSTRRSTLVSGTDTVFSRCPPDPVHTSAEASPRVLRSDSATCSSSSSMGMARDRRLPKVRSTASGASRSP